MFSMIFVSVGLLSALSWRLAAEPPAPPPLSGVMPADDLVAQATMFVESLAAATADEKTYGEKAESMKREVHTLTLLALVLAHHDAEHGLKQSAPALFAASRELAAAADFAAAQAAVASLQAALAGTAAAAPEPAWERVASMGQAMKHVTLAHSRIKRGFRRFDERIAENARDAAVLAAIAQAVVFDTHEVKDPELLDQWYQLCGEMRDAAGELNARIKSADKQGAQTSLMRLSESCDRCHEVFRPEE